MKKEKNDQKMMAERLKEASKDKINRNLKDSVFCNLFGLREYLFQLYQVLHPEDTETKTDDLTIVTLSRVVSREIYNDLGFLVGNKLIVLVEAQSTWSENIVIRFLIYLGETYHRYIQTNGLNEYDSKRVELPKPELYVVYTGERKNRRDKISLKQSFFDNDCCTEVEAKVIFDSQTGDILNQFITFSKVFDSQRKLYPDDVRYAVRETIRLCREKDVLAAYLKKEEAAAVMFTIADQERAYRLALEEDKAEAREEGRAEGRAEGREEGRAEGRAEGREEGNRIRMEHDARGMYAEGIKPDMIARILKVSIEEIERILFSESCAL